MADSTLLLGPKVIIYAAYRRRLTPPLFHGGKSGEKNAFLRSDAAKAKRRLQTVVFATRLQLSLGVRTVSTNRLSSVCFQQSLVGYFSSLRERAKVYINIVF